MAISQRRMTLEEFLRLPEEKPALEFEHGVVTQKVSPKLPHGRLQLTLGRLFDNFAEPIRLAAAFTEPRITFGGNSVVPDLAVYRWSRMPREEHGELAFDAFDPPDIAVEIRSPGQSLRGQINRCRWYVQNGVEVPLLVDPEDRAVRVFRGDANLSVLRGEDR